MEPVYDRAQLLLERNQPNDVLALLQPELTKNFNDPFALELIGHAYYQRGEFGAAANFYKQAHCLRPNVDVLNNLGACFKSIDNVKDAEEVWRMALEMEMPPHKRSGLYANIAGCYTANATPEKALEYYDKALKEDPSNRIAAYNKCWPYMEMRRWKEGLKAYDSGFSCGTRNMRNYDQVPSIDLNLSPEEMRRELVGRKVIVWGDQGLGDEIMAAGCVEDLIQDQKGATFEDGDKAPGSITFDCHPRLKHVFARSFGIECTGTRKTNNIEWFRNRQFDIAVPITTLMTVYRSYGWPGHPYLVPKELQVHGLPRKRPLKVGISWAGGVPSTRAHVRSMPLATLEPLLSQNFEFYSLQYHESAAMEVCRLEEKTGIHVKHYPDTLLAYDYDETISLIAKMDLIITVCTTAMHAAGALGIPCWVMTPSRPPWVMGIEGDKLPMYQSVRL